MRSNPLPIPKAIPEQESESIASVIRRYPDGIEGGVIREEMAFPLPPRTLQRRFPVLGGGWLNHQGTGKGKRYSPRKLELKVSGNHGVFSGSPGA